MLIVFYLVNYWHTISISGLSGWHWVNTAAAAPWRIWINISDESTKTDDITATMEVGSDNGLAPTRRQAIIWTNDGNVKPVPIRAGLSERWWTQLVLKIWRLFPVRKRTLQQGIYNIKSEYKELIHFKIHIYHYLIRIFPRYNQHNSMSISCELMPWHQLWQQLIRRYQLTTVAEKYINQTTTVNL